MFGLPALPRHGLNMNTGVHLLIDLENVQPSPLEVEAWLGEAGEAWVFYGPHQLKRKAAFEVDSPRSTLVPIARPGANSLDFHLVFYLGYLAAKHPECRFVVLAKDTDYDPPIAHANTLAFSVERLPSLSIADQRRLSHRLRHQSLPRLRRKRGRRQQRPRLQRPQRCKRPKPKSCLRRT